MASRRDSRSEEVVLFAMALIDIEYEFGGKNPEAGFDCSGMVSYVYNHAVDVPLQGSAADLAKAGERVEREAMAPGDLVFFNTNGRPHSHVGIYIGDNRFIHAPSSQGAVRIEHLDSAYFDSRFEEARTVFG